MRTLLVFFSVLTFLPDLVLAGPRFARRFPMQNRHGQQIGRASRTADIIAITG
jgi:hypothetical protein